MSGRSLMEQFAALEDLHDGGVVQRKRPPSTALRRAALNEPPGAFVRENLLAYRSGAASHQHFMTQ